MPFAIVLMPADLNAPLPRYQAAIEQAVRADGGRLGPHGSVQMADGGRFTVNLDNFQPIRLTRDMCRVVFDVALRTNTYVFTAGTGDVPVKVAGSTLKTPHEYGPLLVVADADALCVKLRRRLADWDREMTRERRDGVVGADDEPLAPPVGPGDEPRVAHDTSGLAAKCEASERKQAGALGWKIERVVVSRNPQWGIVWRADTAPSADPASWMRTTCWQGKTGVRISVQPLTMFDPSRSAAALPAK